MLTKATLLGVAPVQAIEHAWRLLERDPLLAERQAREVLALLPDDARALLIIGVARRRTGDLTAARTVLERIAGLRPDIARTHYELALTLIAQGDCQAGLAALRRAAAPFEAWLDVEDACVLEGDTEAAWRARAEAMRQIVRKPGAGAQDAIAASDALRAGRPGDALSILRFRLRTTPDDLDLLSLLSQAAFRCGDLNTAEKALARCLQMNATYPRARADYAALLAALGKPHEALAHLAFLLQDRPSAPVRLLAASCYTRAGRAEEAEATAAALVREHPAVPALWLCHGESLRHLGRPAEAEAAFREALARRPGYAAAWWALADLKMLRFSAIETATMRALTEKPSVGLRNSALLNYALGRGLEHQGDFSGAMEAYGVGATAQSARIPHHGARHRQLCHGLQGVFSPALLRGGVGGADEAPIFVVGLPRSGSTLVEQILGSHPDVEATMELPEMALLAGSLGWSHDPACLPGYGARLAELTDTGRAALGRTYLARAARYRRRGRPRFIDKAPENFLHTGLIRLILPQARIVDVRKEPMAACFSAYRQLFAAGHAASYDLAGLGRYYRDYEALMAHFDSVLPGVVLRLRYEDLVVDTGREIQRLLDYCGLGQAPACGRFWEMERPVTTHSAEQVREPVHGRALEEWRLYEAWLGPLAKGLS